MGVVTDLIGRQHELYRFQELLQRSQPTLLLVKGERGSGRSSLLRVLREQAMALQWKAAVLGVTQETTEVDFTVQALEELRISPDFSFSVTSKSSPSIHSLVKQIESQTPAILLIDGYHPNQRFKSWFTEIFLRDLLKLRAAVIVVVADTPKALNELIHHQDAHEVFTLSPLKDGEIRERFELMDHQFHLELREEELEHYVKAVRERPERFKSLARLLEVSQDSPLPSRQPEL